MKKNTVLKRRKPAAPRKRAAPASPLDRVRRICLALPEAHEVTAWGEPTFRVKNKLFAMYAAANNHHGMGRPSVWLKSTHFVQDQLVGEDPDRYFAPPYVGPNGWIGVRLDKRPPWTGVARLIEDAYALIAPAKLRATIASARAGVPRTISAALRVRRR